jgi:hypothetical protein
VCSSDLKQYQGIPLIIDGIFGILDNAYQDLAIKIIKIHNEYAILLTNPQSFSCFDFNDIANHYKIIAKIHKDHFQSGFEGHAEFTETKSQDFSCRIELV